MATKKTTKTPKKPALVRVRIATAVSVEIDGEQCTGVVEVDEVTAERLEEQGHGTRED